MASVIPGSGLQGSSFANPSGSVGGISGQDSQGEGLAQAGKEQVKRLGGVTRERVFHQVDGKKEEFIKSLHGLADTLQGAGKDANLGVAQSLVDGAIQLIQRVSNRLEQGTTEELVREAQTQVRQRPGLFIAGCVALGFFAGRLMKI
ncbi:MAG: hypothetical protein ACJ8AT_12410 [Hyalangium sp.]|uniref:hypothetical protein n=1 Tax=Hyalangium sp. TaxID=2028555 RepID=UPI00389A5924